MKKNKELNRPLTEAVRALDLEALKSLLDQGADPDAEDEDGWRPLHRLAEICEANGAGEAQEKAAVKAAKLLIRRGANVDARIEGLGQSPAYVAALSGNDELFAALAIAEADLDGAAAPGPDAPSQTPLCAAVRAGAPEHFIRMLIGAGADPRYQDGNGESLLHVAARVCGFQTMKYLASQMPTDIRGADGSVAAHAAAEAGNDAALRALAGFGADLFAKDGQGRSPSDKARAAGRSQCLLILESMERAAAASPKNAEESSKLEAFAALVEEMASCLPEAAAEAFKSKARKIGTIRGPR